MSTPRLRFYTTRKEQIVYKKIQASNYGKQYILELILPAGTRCYGRTAKKAGTAHDRKNRAEHLVPLAFYDVRGNYIGVNSDLKLSSKKEVRHSGFFDARPITYTLGELVKPDHFSIFHDSCAGGIHFFYNVEDAINWG